MLKATSLAVGAAFLLVGLASAALVAPIPVKTTSRSELAPAAGGDWFAWTKSRGNDSGSLLDVWAQRGTEPAFKVNPRNTQGYTGGTDGARLVYQLIRGANANRSDLRLFDLSTRRHLPLPRGVNTTRWECCGTISGDWLLHSRGLVYTRNVQLLLLRNLVTGEVRVLDKLQNKNGLLSAGQVSGNYAVWARCSPHPRCQIRRYDIVAGARTILPVPTGKVVYSPSITATGDRVLHPQQPGLRQVRGARQGPSGRSSPGAAGAPERLRRGRHLREPEAPKRPDPDDHRRLFRPGSLRTEHLGHLPGRGPGGARAASAAVGYPVLATMTSS